MRNRLLQVPAQHKHSRAHQQSRVRSIRVQKRTKNRERRQPCRARHRTRPTRQLFNTSRRRPQRVFQCKGSHVLSNIPTTSQRRQRTRPRRMPMRPCRFQRLLYTKLKRQQRTRTRKRPSPRCLRQFRLKTKDRRLLKRHTIRALPTSRVIPQQAQRNDRTKVPLCRHGARRCSNKPLQIRRRTMFIRSTQFRMQTTSTHPM